MGKLLNRFKILLISLIFSLRIFSQENILRFTHLTVDDGLPQNTIHGIVKDKYGFMWFGTWAGLCRFDGYKVITYRNEVDNANSINNSRIHYIYLGPGDTLWIETFDNSVVCRYNYEKDNFDRVPRDKVPKNLKDSLSRRTNYSRTHIAKYNYQWEINRLNNSLYQRNLKNNKQFVYQTDPLNRWSLNDDYATDLYLDDNEILWVGTFSSGINRANTKMKPFSYYYSSSEPDKTLIDDNVRGICVDNKGFLWVGSRNKGLTRIDRKNNKYTYFQKSDRNEESLINNQIRMIYCDKSGMLWFGTKGGISKYDPERNKFSSYTAFSKNRIPHNWVYWIMEDHEGTLWIGTYNGIAKYNREENRFVEFNPDRVFTDARIRVILEDEKLNFWIATEGGGVILLKREISGKLDTLHPTIYLNTTLSKNSLSNNRVYSMVIDEKDIVWIGTAGGLNRFDPEKNEFTRFTEKAGFIDDMIMGLLPDKKGHLWISHTKGLTRLNTETFKQRNYSVRDGLQSNEFSEDAYFRDSVTGEMFFGGIHGLNSFIPDSIKDDYYLPKVVLTGLRINNQPVLVNKKINDRIILNKQLFLTREIRLNHLDKSIDIEFSALHYSNSWGNLYKYMLEGFDKKWIETTALKRNASYSNLSPGTYFFKVLASNSDGIWNPDPVILKIYVIPPWWKSTLAYIAYILIIIASIYAVTRYIVSRERIKGQLYFNKLETEKIRELDELKLEFFTKISHEIRTPLSLIIGPIEEITKELSYSSKFVFYANLLKQNANRLLSLVNQLLDFRKVEAGYLKLEATESDIVDFVRRTYEGFQLLAEQRDINYLFKSQLESKLIWFDEDKLGKILSNLLSNAFNYTSQRGEIIVSLQEKTILKGEASENYMEIAVKDNGIGISDEDKDKIFTIFYQVQQTNKNGSGIGLALVKELIQLHNGFIELDSEPDKGSNFRVYLPIKRMGNNLKSIEQSVVPEIIESEAMRLPLQYEISDSIKDEIPEDNDATMLLVIEDNDELRSFIVAELKDVYKTYETADGITGFELAKECIPDLIISDIMMPGVNGLDLCKKLKTDERTCHIPVILLTAKQGENYKIEGYETGADDYITKPFSTSVLKARIHNLIETRHKLREIFSNQKADFSDKFVALNSLDQNFITRATRIIEDDLDNSGFDSDVFAAKLNMSRAQLYRKIKALTNQTVHGFITTIRLNKAAGLLLKGELSISEVAYEVGYSLPNNFSRSFTKQFGKTPSEYISSHIKK